MLPKAVPAPTAPRVAAQPGRGWRTGTAGGKGPTPSTGDPLAPAAGAPEEAGKGRTEEQLKLQIAQLRKGQEFLRLADPEMAGAIDRKVEALQGQLEAGRPPAQRLSMAQAKLAKREKARGAAARKVQELHTALEAAKEALATAEEELTAAREAEAAVRAAIAERKEGTGSGEARDGTGGGEAPQAGLARLWEELQAGKLGTEDTALLHRLLARPPAMPPPAPAGGKAGWRRPASPQPSEASMGGMDAGDESGLDGTRKGSRSPRRGSPSLGRGRTDREGRGMGGRAGA